ncbi:DNA topoisomerase IV, alpha subunit [Auriscalpium vulgare]|uniref:DNA topoisomerase IV, alpha subunit n=1 Tax=Auriscalpium vulgare TaxID=40419 RepID=A0ACB8RGU5_9AGAM|nr:DNA topoisomerase IV, alpha subunit [Auriscalpium vulgare]
MDGDDELYAIDYYSQISGDTLGFSDSDDELVLDLQWASEPSSSATNSQEPSPATSQESVEGDMLDLEEFYASEDDLPFDLDALDPMGLTENLTTSLEIIEDILQDYRNASDSDSEGGSDEDEDDSSRTEAISKIEAIVLKFLKQVSDAIPSPSVDGPLQLLELPKKLELKIADRRKAPKDGEMSMRVLRYPMTKRGGSIKPFAQFFRVAELAHEALINDIPTTKRDLFYKDVPLFKSQGVVDRLVDDLAATIDLGRADLNIRASSKGLVCGVGLSIHLFSGDIMKVVESEGTLIPVAEDIERFDLTEGIKWVLVVEKEAVFQTLCRLHFVRDSSLPGPGIMITGKGYPDIATRQLVKTLSDNLPSTIPILILVDGDAYGLEIASVYKYGSQSLRHESSRLAAARVKCIGVWASELPAMGIDRDTLLPISAADEKKARAMLCRAPEQLPSRWKRELMRMLHTRRKAETEILSSVVEDPVSGKKSHALAEYLVRQVCARVRNSRFHLNED